MSPSRLRWDSLAGRRFLLLAALGLIVSAPRHASAEDAPRPEKKDSRPQARPKEASFETSVSPKTAKPGDVVTYSVTAKLDLDWHIYAYSKTQSDSGPRSTQFDFFGKGGLTMEGDWEFSIPPLQEKDPNFPDVPFVEYHDKEITWSVKLRVPRDAKAGKVNLLSQAYYQICSKSSCSFPGRWTLPPAELTIEGPAKSKSAAGPMLVSLLTGFVPQEAPRPKKKDTRETLRGKEARLSASLSKTSAKPGETVVCTIKAELDPGWHIYKYSKADVDDGPSYTKFEFFQTGGLTPEGDWTPAAPPIKKREPVFKNLEFLEFYEKEAAWSLTLKVPPDAKPGKTSLQCQASYQICDAKSCQRETFWTMPALELTIEEGGAAAVAPTTPPTQPIVTSTPSEPASAIAGAPAPPLNAGEQKLGGGLLVFLLWSAGGGLAALVMPCVWPMIPITVNFFVKQGQKKGGKTTPLALAYCLSIIGIFTGIGVLFSAVFGASSIARLANNPWLNVGVATLFIAFGLSLLGLFEISLPNFVLNASAQREGKGGLVGVMFMALTLTITSFTCTFPVVGALVVMAAGGDYFYPTVGLLTFSTVLALPFFLLALSPGLLSKVPKSGDWMNTVKVVGGLVEIGAAFKFANTAECAFGTVPSEAWFNAPTVLTIWIVLAAVCGIYMLGLFRTDHDHEEIKIGPGRMMLGSGFLFLALYLAPALFGNPPHGPIYGRLIVGILPPDAGELGIAERLLATGPVSAGEGGGRTVKATSTDPAQAEREQTSFHGVVWGMSYDAALERASAEKRPVLIDFTGVNCSNCRAMEQEVLPKAEIVGLLKRFVTVQLYTDVAQLASLTREQKEAVAEKNAELERRLTRATTNPYYVILTPKGELIDASGGYMEAADFQKFLAAGLRKFEDSAKVALGN